MVNCPSKCSYLCTPMGAVKLTNVIFGLISLTLVAVSFTPVLTLTVFLGTVIVCLSISCLYIIFHLTAPLNFVHSKANRVANFIYHALAGVALIIAGIELIGWSNYDGICKRDCSHMYTIRISKTLTFINGVLYLIVGFLGIKDDDQLDSSEAEEEIPLLHSNDILTSVPGKVIRSCSVYRVHDSQSIHYGRNKSPFYYDDARAHYYFARQNFHYNQSHAEYSFNNSLNSGSGIHFYVPPGQERRPRANSVSSNRSVRSVTRGTAPPPTPHQPNGSPELDRILEQ